MKKICIFICVFFCLFSACSPRQGTQNASNQPPSAYDQLLESGEYYRIYKSTLTSVYYEIYNSRYEIVLSGEIDRPLAIHMLNENTIEISIGMGTGLSVHTYYSIKRDLVSESFSYVIAASNELIAYIDGSSIESRTVVVQNAFDKALFYAEFNLDFSSIDTPVIQASFSDDETELQLVYLSGESQMQTNKTLYLK